MLAGAFAITATPGPGLDPDAMSYLGAAQSLVAEGTFRTPWAPWWSALTNQPLTHFPPGFSTAIAIPVWYGLDAIQGARLVQAFSAGVTALTFVILLWPVAGGVGAVLAVIALALMPAFVQVHLSVLSEPLFLALLVLLLWAMIYRPRSALTHGLIAAAATMVRYAGIAFAGAAALWALRDKSASWRLRLTRAAAAIAPSLLLMATWSVTRSHAPGKAETIRKIALYGNLMPTLREGAKSVAHHLAPTNDWEAVPRTATVLAIVTLVVLVWSTVRAEGEVLPEPSRDDPRWREQREVLRACALLALAYLALVGASRLFADPNIPLDFRMVVPLAPLAVASVAVVGARAARVISTPAKVLGALAVTGWMGAAVVADYQQVSDALTFGGDFGTALWKDSPTLGWVKQQPTSRTIYTNLPCEIWFQLGQESRAIPTDLADSTMRRFAQRLRDTNGAMVVWWAQSLETANSDSVAKRAGLVMVADYPDGTVYVAPPLASNAAAPSAPSPSATGAPSAPIAPAARPR